MSSSNSGTNSVEVCAKTHETICKKLLVDPGVQPYLEIIIPENNDQ